MLKIELDASNCKLQTRQLPPKDGKAGRNLYWQIGYMHTGGRYPVEVQIPLEEGQPAYPAGPYFVHPSSFQASKYNNPEFKPFAFTLAPLNEIDSKPKTEKSSSSY
ncbi:MULTISPECIES: G5P family DNA-binding protein [unclassified Shewanella]|uniref:G5P family DNA-binding protein n=1 Tax=unclassified Shewanella TaxID=196818 RepID=UPI0021D8B4AA|nr:MULTISPECIES: G5P family DNA-binding protein [unclassified Shewanella]MCU8036855.1 G5P family DNA-binding protein [Shewanella sp. SM71]MCU8096999.1 G5P family DNA-binding protein [Shewanella sp. SM102]